jgi:hypothetical protein
VPIPVILRPFFKELCTNFPTRESCTEVLCSCLLVARSLQSWNRLREAVSTSPSPEPQALDCCIIDKTYLALGCGHLPASEGRFTLHFAGRHRRSAKVSVSLSGRLHFYILPGSPPLCAQQPQLCQNPSCPRPTPAPPARIPLQCNQERSSFTRSDRTPQPAL